MVRLDRLVRGTSKSCGCLQKEVAADGKRTHGQSRHPLYRVWIGAWSRCTLPQRKEWPNYGGRGIYVCAEWETFEPFFAWAMANGYEPGLDLDRIDNGGPYSPENCRFVSRSENLRNMRRSRRIEAFGETMTMADWAEDPRCVVGYSTIESRLRKGWDPEDALTRPLHKRMAT